MKLSLEEQVTRDFLRYVGVPMAPGSVVVGTREDGTPVERYFDLISEDGSVVASIQTSCLHIKSRPGQKAYASLYRVLGALLYLHLCPRCQSRYVVLTDREMYDEIRGEFSKHFKDIIILHWDDIRK